MLGTFHVPGRKHLQRYLEEMVLAAQPGRGRASDRCAKPPGVLVGKRLTWAELTAWPEVELFQRDNPSPWRNLNGAGQGRSSRHGEGVGAGAFVSLGLRRFTRPGVAGRWPSAATHRNGRWSRSQRVRWGGVRAAVGPACSDWLTSRDRWRDRSPPRGHSSHWTWQLRQT